jgi:hypothetical protein
MIRAEAMALYYGNARKPLARIVPDGRWPGMWRISWSDGRLSDMVNLSRAKDAAIALCERGPPARNRRLFHWKKEPSKTGPAASPIRQNGERASPPPSVITRARARLRRAVVAS